MYKRILVAVDGSSTSDLALQEATKLARTQEAKLRILHVVDEVTFNWDTEFAYLNEIQAALTKSGEEILRKAQTVAQETGVQADTKLAEIVQFGRRIANVIVEEADNWPADLIVIGTHGRRGFSHLLLGSVAEDVVRISPKPVLLIRGR